MERRYCFDCQHHFDLCEIDESLTSYGVCPHCQSTNIEEPTEEDRWLREEQMMYVKAMGKKR